MPGFDTLWPADSAEFCPHSSWQDLFVCGTYKLEQSPQQGGEENELSQQDEGDVSPTENTLKKPQKRRGKCLLFRAQDQPCVA